MKGSLSFDFSSPTRGRVIVARDGMELPITAQDGNITVIGGQLPEPGSLPLLGLGVLAWVLMRRGKPWPSHVGI